MFSPSNCNPCPTNASSSASTFTLLTIGSMVGLGILGSALALNSTRNQDSANSSTDAPVQRHVLVRRAKSPEKELPQQPRIELTGRLQRRASLESHGEERLQSIQDGRQSKARNRLQRRPAKKALRGGGASPEPHADRETPQPEAAPVNLGNISWMDFVRASQETPNEKKEHNETRANLSRPNSHPEEGNPSATMPADQHIPLPPLNPQSEDPNEAVRANIRLAKRNSAHNSQWANLQPNAGRRRRGRGRNRSRQFEGEEEAIRRSIHDQQVMPEEQEAVRESLREQENSQREQEAISRSLHDQQVIKEEEDEQEVLLRALKRQESLLIDFEEKQAADARELQEQRDVVAQLRERLMGLET